MPQYGTVTARWERAQHGGRCRGHRHEQRVPHLSATRRVRNPSLLLAGFDAAPSLSFKRMGKTGHFMMMEQPVYLASVLLAFGVSAEYRFEE